MTDTKNKAYNYYLKRCQETGFAFDLYDFEAEVDSTLTYIEMINKLEDEVFSAKAPIDTAEKLYEQQGRYKQLLQNCKQGVRQQELSTLHKKKVIVVFGDTRSGKTAMSYNILEAIKKHKRCFVYKHPIPSAMKILGFGVVSNISEVARLQDCALYVDEPQLSFPRDEKKDNIFLGKLCTLAGQRGITLIFSTSDSRWINKGTEAFVTTWFIKDCDAESLKNGSKIKTIIKNVSTFGLVDFKLAIEEYIYFDREETLNNGKYTFSLPLFWDEEILSTPYRL